MRTSNHDKALRQYQIVDGKGIVVEKPLIEYSGVLSGIPTLRTFANPQQQEPVTSGLTETEESLMHVLLALREATVLQLVEALDSTERQIRRTLDKLVDTGYVAKADTPDGPRYRVALVTPALHERKK
jgi:DNA-binding transcriptional ArsR family regulator